MNECVYTKDVVLDKDGYPRVKHQGRLWRLNRLIYTYVNGEIPSGSVIGHSCNNKGCINPTHLYQTTIKGNSSDAARDGLYKSGEANHRAKITLETARLIRKQYSEYGWTQSFIGHVHDLEQSTISAIVREKSWKEK